MTTDPLIKLDHIECPRCGAQNTLPAGDDCTACGKSLGMFRRLVTLMVTADGKPAAGWTRALSEEEIALLQREPYALFRLPVRQHKPEVPR